MKRNETTCLLAIAILFFMSFGCVSAVATGLSLTVNYVLLGLACLLLAVILAVLYSIPKGGRYAVGIGLGLLLFMVLDYDFRAEVMSLSRRAMEFYSRGYGFEMPEVLQKVPDTSHFWPLFAVAGIINVVGAWTILHRYPSALAVFVTIFPMVSCFVVIDTVPQIWALAVWIMGLGLLVMTQTVRIQSHGSANRLTLMLSVPLLVVVTLIFLLIPQQGYYPPFTYADLQGSFDWVIEGIPFIGQTADGNLVMNFGGDLNERVDLEGMDDRNTTSSAVLEVTASHSETIYLRIRDYDAYNGIGWQSTKRQEVFIAPPSTLTGTERTISIRVLGNRTQLLVPYYPKEGLELENGMASTKANNREYSYQVTPLRYNWDVLWRIGLRGDIPAADPIYLELPEATAAAAQTILADIHGLTGRDTVQAAQRIGSYVCKTAKYSQEVEQMPAGEDFAIWFMESADRGFCVHFATAATVLLRAQGIPARYVEGFALEGVAHQNVQVTQDMAHAWVEYYVPSVGWVILDPTPGFGGVEEYVEPTNPSTAPSAPTTRPSQPDQTEPTTEIPSVTTQPSESQTTSTSSVTTSTSSATSSATESTGDTSSQGKQTVTSTKKGQQEVPREPMPEWLVKLLIGLAALAGSLLLLLGQWMLRRMWKLRRLSSGTNAQRVIARYRETCRICRARKMPVEEELTTLAEKAGFSQHEITKEELETVSSIFRTHFQNLQNGRWYQKLYWRFILALY